MRVLVTGAAGYIGRAVVYRLVATGHEVTALVPRPPTNGTRFPAGTRLAVADLRVADRITEVVAAGDYDGVCHLAALTRVRESFDNPLPYFTVNVQGTVNLLEALDRRTQETGHPARLVFASTGAVYGTGRSEPISEDQQPMPRNPYAASKLAAEGVIDYQTGTGSLAAVSLRCFNAAGATAEVGDTDPSRLVPKALAVARGLAPCLEVNGDGTAVRELTHVADLADAYALALEAAEAGTHQIFNVGSGVGVSINEVIAAVEDVTGRPLTVRTRPARNEPQVLIADSSRLRSRLRWQPARSTLHDIIADAWRWMRTHLG